MLVLFSASLSNARLAPTLQFDLLPQYHPHNMTSNAAEERKGPNYVYKLVPPSMPVPDPLPERLEVSDLDESSGFIHLSTSIQVPGTLKHFFAD